MEDKIMAEIFELIDRLNSCSDKNGVLFAYGNFYSGLAAANTRGDMSYVSMAVCNRMDVIPEFKEVMLSVLGTYLINKPEDRQAFMQYLEQLEELHNEPDKSDLDKQLKEAIKTEDFERAALIKKRIDTCQ